MINKNTIGLMNNTTIIVNTSRDEIIKDDNPIENLESGEILGTGLDAFENEPVVCDNMFSKLKNVVLLPHSTKNTADSAINMAKHCIVKIMVIRNGESVSNSDVVNYKYLNN